MPASPWADALPEQPASTLPPTLPISIVDLQYQAQGRVCLPSPAVGVCRGQLGAYLRRMAPTADHEQGTSLYARLFRTPRSAVAVPELPAKHLGALGLTGAYLPHPFVLRLSPPRPPGEDVQIPPHGTFQLRLVLIGEAVESLPELGPALEALGQDGLGRKTRQGWGTAQRGRVRLVRADLRAGPVALQVFEHGRWRFPGSSTRRLADRIRAISTQLSSDAGTPAFASSPPAAPGTGGPLLHIACCTPVRLKHAGSLVGPAELSPDALAANLIRRVIGLAVCYGQAKEARPEEAPSSLADRIREVRSMFDQLAEQTTLHQDSLQWTDDDRYSSRQKQSHPAGGLTGAFHLDAPDEALQIWRRWLRAAEPLHLGKKTSLGLGQICVGARLDDCAGTCIQGDRDPNDS